MAKKAGAYIPDQIRIAGVSFAPDAVRDIIATRCAADFEVGVADMFPADGQQAARIVAQQARKTALLWAMQALSENGGDSLTRSAVVRLLTVSDVEIDRVIDESRNEGAFRRLASELHKELLMHVEESKRSGQILTVNACPTFDARAQLQRGKFKAAAKRETGRTPVAKPQRPLTPPEAINVDQFRALLPARTRLLEFGKVPLGLDEALAIYIGRRLNYDDKVLSNALKIGVGVIREVAEPAVDHIEGLLQDPVHERLQKAVESHIERVRHGLAPRPNRKGPKPH